MISPKQPPHVTKRDWYPYYAGFTERFAEAVLSKHLADSISVLDPWNGSGTTTLVCARSGIPSTGIDVNPALTVIARARLTPRTCQPTILDALSRILKDSRAIEADCAEDDPLGQWLHKTSIRRLRALQLAIHFLLAPDAPLRGSDAPPCVQDSLPTLACFFYTALFATVRDLVGQFQATNPMWFKNALSPQHKITIAGDQLTDTYAKYTRQLEARLRLNADVTTPGVGTLHTGSATALAIPDGHFGGVLTSPPYATRVDYIMGTLPELAVLGLDAARLSELRLQTIGTPVVSCSTRGLGCREIVSGYANSLLTRIATHPSKGSRRYYFPWMENYISGLQTGLFETTRTVRPDGIICIVVQDSYYKAVHIGLQQIVTEILGHLGKVLVARDDFEVRALRSRMNPRARRHLARRKNIESLLVFA